MKKQAEVYLYGQILATRSILLRDGFLKPDEYSEISEQYFLPGGETGTAATVLCSLGVNVIMDGTHIGYDVAPVLKDFYKDKSADLSLLCYTEQEGVTDTVVIAGNVRSPMGRFQTLFSTGRRWWGIPKAEDMAGCKAAAVDPYFGEESLLAARLCKAAAPGTRRLCRATKTLRRSARPWNASAILRMVVPGTAHRRT